MKAIRELKRCSEFSFQYKTNHCALERCLQYSFREKKGVSIFSYATFQMLGYSSKRSVIKRYFHLQSNTRRERLAASRDKNRTMWRITWVLAIKNRLITFQAIQVRREFAFSYDRLLHCKACSRSEAYTVLSVRKGESSFKWLIAGKHTTSANWSTVVFKRTSDHKQYYRL